MTTTGRIRTPFAVPAAFALLLLVSIACQPSAAQPTAAPAKPATAQAGPTVGASAAQDDLVAKAKQEGEVIIYLGRAGSRQLIDAFKPFEEKYRIKTTAVIGSGNENADKVLAERDAGLFTADLWMGGLTTVTTRMIPKAAFDPIEPTLEWPEVKDASLQFQGKRWFGDPESKYTILFSARATPLFSYNTNLVKETDFQSWQDLLDPKWRGKIVSREPTSSGIGSIMAFFYFNPDQSIGPEFLRRLYTEQNVAIVNDARQGAEGLALGKYALFFLPGGNDVNDMMDQGLPVRDFVRPLKEGGQLAAGGTGTISIFNKPKHPNASKLFVNWWLSKEGQVAAQNANPLDESLRQDVPKDMLRPEWKRIPGGNYYFSDADPIAQGNQDKMQAYMKTVMASRKP